ncbi:hypothetical protein [Aquimonas voraii]|uniref:Uncharacterized protein n=1 Tax=Aquimonas voraii TaxID=265719 RepID=A0A1G6TXK9_9GAMM|nr:hypothetical protein [Aquimonas voraii]SDD33035.1 hypothetical protein SAMN04488509_10224 [Aquimonas voraii]
MDTGIDLPARIEHGLSALALGLLLWGPVPPEALLRFTWAWFRILLV